ncbi:MAG: hypothetical protein ACE5Q6_01285 [Dehalococcoidia bacterium]
MEPDTINLLLIEDNPDDALLIEASLSDVKDRRFRLEHATRLSEGLERLSQGASTRSCRTCLCPTVTGSAR